MAKSIELDLDDADVTITVESDDDEVEEEVWERLFTILYTGTALELAGQLNEMVGGLYG